MKNVITLIALLISLHGISQNTKEKSITSKINAVTVFLESAQITRTKTLVLEKGETLLKFTKLSPYINAKSIQVKTTGVEIHAVNFQKNYLKRLKKDSGIIALEKEIEIKEEELILAKTKLSILNEELQFLKSNRSIGGSNQNLNVTILRNTSQFYGEKLSAIKMKQIAINKNIKTLNIAIAELNNQIKNFEVKKDTSSGEIIVKVKNKNAKKCTFSLVYNVSNAGWYPSYDIRAKNINSPLQLVYKANVKQNTKVDWNNVKIRFSSADPNTSSTAPELKPYYLDYGSVPPSYLKNINEVSGKVQDESGGLPGVSVLVKGTTIGTETDFEGNYSIAIPNKNAKLVYSFLGYKTEERNIYASKINVAMHEDANVLDEVVVTAYSSSSLRGKSSGVRIRGASSIKSKPKYDIPTVEIINQTTVDFAIVAPYTVKSNNKNYTVGMKTYELPASYKYISIPKVDTNAFLIANIVNWEKYNLLEGEANLYFEDTFIGKSLLDTRYTKDTLKISLGRDKNVVVQREKVKNFTTKQFIGNKKEETKQWKILVKNNKNQPIHINVLDQIPVSTREEIKITIDKITNGKFNDKTGKISWNLKINPSKTKNLILKYKVKYPKYRNLVLD